MREEVLKIIDVAKDVADRYTYPLSPGVDIEARRKKTDEWTEIFDKAYKAIKATVQDKKEFLSV